MLVKTLFPHSNGFGAVFAKAVGDEYALPEDCASPLIDAGLVVTAGEALPVPGKFAELVEKPARAARKAANDNSLIDDVQQAQDGPADQG